MRLFWQWELLPYSQTKEDICAFKAALTFIDSVTEIFSALLSGHTLVVFPRNVLKNVQKFIQVLIKITFFIDFLFVNWSCAEGSERG